MAWEDEAIVWNVFFLWGGIAFCAAVIVFLDWLGQRQERRRKLKEQPQEQL